MLQKKYLLKYLAAFCIATFLIVGTGCGDNPPQSSSSSVSSSSSSSSSSPKMTAEEKAAKEKADKAEKKAASDEIKKILSQLPQTQDEVENSTQYTSWGNGSIPARTALYYKVSVKDNKVSPVGIYVIQFTDDTQWIFWDNMIFANNGNKWSKKLNTFAGQSGDGKHTEVVMGGKYETWSGNIDEVADGLNILVSGGNKPILRVTGQEYKADIHPTDSDIQQMQTALHLNDLLKKINYTLVD